MILNLVIEGHRLGKIGLGVKPVPGRRRYA